MTTQSRQSGRVYFLFIEHIQNLKSSYSYTSRPFKMLYVCPLVSEPQMLLNKHPLYPCHSHNIITCLLLLTTCLAFLWLFSCPVSRLVQTCPDNSPSLQLLPTLTLTHSHWKSPWIAHLSWACAGDMAQHDSRDSPSMSCCKRLQDTILYSGIERISLVMKWSRWGEQLQHSTPPSLPSALSSPPRCAYSLR